MVASALTDTQGIIAIAAAGVAVVALIVAISLAVALRRLRNTQRVVMGDHQERDLIDHAAGMQDAFKDLQDYVEEAAVRLDGRLAQTEQAMRGVFAHRALVRYDAYNELSGHQSMSIALLDEERSGIVLSCIHHRDQARVYGKQVRDGHGEIELSPEEAEAVRLAMTAPRTPGGPGAAAGGAPSGEPGGGADASGAPSPGASVPGAGGHGGLGGNGDGGGAA